MCVPIGMTIGNSLATARQRLDGQQISCPIRSLGSNHHPSLGSKYPGLPARLSNLEKEASDPLSGSVRCVTNQHLFPCKMWFGGQDDLSILHIAWLARVARLVEQTTACPAWLLARLRLLGRARRLNLCTHHVKCSPSVPSLGRDHRAQSLSHPSFATSLGPCHRAV